MPFYFLRKIDPGVDDPVFLVDGWYRPMLMSNPNSYNLENGTKRD
jgi:hypothetical protein